MLSKMIFKYSSLVCLAAAAFVSQVYGDLFPILPAPTIIATCNVVPVSFGSTTAGIAKVIFAGHVVEKHLPIIEGGNGFPLYVKECTKLGRNDIVILDSATGTSVSYPVTVVNGCSNCCESSSSSDSSSSSSC